MRRKDREVTDKLDIIKIIEKCDVCRVGLSFDNTPYIVPMNFGFEYIDDKLTLYFHGALEGKKVDIMRINPNACFEMDCSHQLITNEKAENYSMEYESVIGNGTISICTDKDDKIKALSQIMKKYADGKPFEFNDNILKRVAIFKLIVTDFTGKRHFKS